MPDAGSPLPASPWRLIAYFPDGKQSCETTPLRPRHLTLQRGQQAVVARKEWAVMRMPILTANQSDLGESKKVPPSPSITERPLCQEADPGINLRRRATMMVTIWRSEERRVGKECRCRWWP